MPTDCKKNQIRNPASKRCVKRSGVIGRKLLQNREENPEKTEVVKSKSCDESKILNPASNRCVKRDGVIGRKLLEVVTPVSPIGTPSKFKKIIEDCQKNKTFKKKKKLGEGKYGSAYQVCKVNDCKFAIKEQNADSEFKHEVDALYALNSWKHSPKIHAAWTCNGKGYIIQDLVYKCKKNPGYDELRKVIDQMRSKGWVHVDIHSGNIMCTKDGTLMLIDFGWARNSSDGMVTDHAIGNMENIKSLPWSLLVKIEDENINRLYDMKSQALTREIDGEIAAIRKKEKNPSGKSNYTSKSINSAKKKLF